MSNLTYSLKTQAARLRKIFFILCGIICAINLKAAADWTAKTSGTTKDLHSVFFATEDIGWVSGADGTILRTTNAGTDWTAQTSSAAVALKTIAFKNYAIGVAAGENGTIVRTTDGGTTWAAVNSGVAFTLNKLFWISDNVWAVGNSGTILKSTDSGATWASGASTAPTTNHLKSVYFINSSTGWACGVNTILRTSDGGSSWSKFTDAISATDIFFVDVSTGWFTDDTGGSGFIWTSNDSGVSWTLKKSTTSSLNSLYFINPSTGWAAGIGGTIMITTDNGKSFQSDISSGSANFSSIFISTGGTGFVAGASGAIFKRTAPIRVPEVSTTVIVEQGDFKAVNNLFDPSKSEKTTVQYRVNKSGKTTIRIFTMQGRLIRTIADQYIDAGSYSADWDGKNEDGETVASGIYLAHIEAPEFSKSYKIAVVK